MIFNEEFETLPREALESLQLKRLKQVVERVYHTVGYYRKKFEEAGVAPEDIKGLDDLKRLPFSSKQDLRDNYPFGLFSVPMSNIVRLHASSGTTGKPTVVAYTKRDIETWAELMARSFAAAGLTRNDIIHNAYGYGLFTGGLGAHYGAEKLGASVIPMSGGNTKKQIMILQDFGPTAICCTPSYLLFLAETGEEMGIDMKSLRLRVGILGAEPWSERMRAEIESRLDITALDIYGLSEVVGPGVSCEAAETKDGLHIWEDHFYPEIIDPVTGEVLPDGEQGELVFTSLTKQAFPVIRYRTKDLTRLLPGTAYPTMRRMEKVTGRTDDMMIIRGVNVFPTQIEEIILAEPGLAPYFQCVLSQPGNMLELTVLAESNQTLGDSERLELEKRISKRIKDNIGTTAKIEVRAPGGIERSVGKARRIVDTRKSPFPT